MLTIRQETRLIDKIKRLSELELQSLFEELSEHFNKNGLSHVADVIIKDKLDSLQSDLDAANEAIEDLERHKDELDDKLERVYDLVSDADNKDEDELPELIDKIRDLI